jgi:hypothetical protein
MDKEWRKEHCPTPIEVTNEKTVTFRTTKKKGWLKRKRYFLYLAILLKILGLF